MIRSNHKYKRHTLKKWFHSPIQTYEGSATDKKGRPITHGHFVSQLYNDIQKIIFTHGYHINDKNAFKNELVRYIYKISDDNAT